MTNVTAQIDQYVIQHNVAQPGSGWSLTSIYCYSKSQTGYKIFGILGFYAEGNMPKSYISSEGYPVFCFPIGRYEDTIATLRYEKPVTLVCQYDAKNLIYVGYLTTGLEPTGEQEGV